MPMCGVQTPRRRRRGVGRGPERRRRGVPTRASPRLRFCSAVRSASAVRAPARGSQNSGASCCAVGPQVGLWPAADQAPGPAPASAPGLVGSPSCLRLADDAGAALGGAGAGASHRYRRAAPALVLDTCAARRRRQDAAYFHLAACGPRTTSCAPSFCLRAGAGARNAPSAAVARVRAPAPATRQKAPLPRPRGRRRTAVERAAPTDRFTSRAQPHAACCLLPLVREARAAHLCVCALPSGVARA